jgi:hypothetical protein
MNKYYTWFRRLLGFVVVVDIILGILSIFLPNSTLRLLGQSPSHDVLWTAYGGLALALIGFLCWPAVRDPLRYEATARWAVIVQAAFAVFFLVIWPSRYLLFGVLDLIFFAVLAVLLWVAKREPQPDWQPATD